MPTEIHTHYEARYREEERLTEPSSVLEFLRTTELMGRFLPRPPAVVLDVGGATGIYALRLSEAGYDVHLVDPVARHIALAEASSSRARPLASVRRGDARDLQQEDESIDVVLALGPLYHLTERADRRRALREVLRVLRPGGVLCAAAISRFASTYDGLARGGAMEPEFELIIARDVAEGQHRNPTDRPEWFTTAYFHHPEELRGEIRDAGFDIQDVFAVEGPGWFLADLDAWLADEKRREVLLRNIRRVETEPSLLGASPHLLAIARRP